MIKYKKSDLLFLSQLDVQIKVTALPTIDEDIKRCWELYVEVENNGFNQKGFLYGARGEVRKFYQLNALVDTCMDYLGNCSELKVQLKK